MDASEVEVTQEADIDLVWPELAPLFQALNEHHRPLTGQTTLPDWEERVKALFGPALRSGNSILLVARRSGQAVAFLNAHFLENAGIFQGNLGFIDNAYVKPELRGRGIASRLLDAAEAWLREQGATDAELNVAVANEHAVRVWEAKGYEPFSERRRKRLV
jgi:ribosomal protein S18 acetylase RimI-like enzyme